jgi:hypothetical protein
MGSYTEDDLPFNFSLANTFTLANRWFCSVPAQTYPNRRIFMAGTASGIVSTDIDNVTTYPANGTIWDLLSAHGISWKNYFSNAPTTAVIVDTLFRHPANLTSIAEFFVDAAAGTLPAVSLVDCNMGAVQGEIPSIVGALADLRRHTGPGHRDDLPVRGEPEDVQLGEQFVAGVVNAVMAGPAWPRTLLVWLYDEHGGYYDDVAPPSAIPPDAIPPDIGPTDQPGSYNRYGPRVPVVVVVSPFSRPHDVTNVVHDTRRCWRRSSASGTCPRSPPATPTPPPWPTSSTPRSWPSPSLPTWPPRPTPSPGWSGATRASRHHRRRRPPSRPPPDPPLAPARGPARKVCDIGVREAVAWSGRRGGRNAH